jgi:hypothetical protein
MSLSGSEKNRRDIKRRDNDALDYIVFVIGTELSSRTNGKR